MTPIDHHEYIDELLYTIKRKDSIKANILLRHIDQLDEQTQRRLIFELSRTDDAFSLPLLASLISGNPGIAVKVSSLKQILIGKFLDNPALLVPYIDPKNKVSNRMVFVEIAGEIRCEDAAPYLLALMKAEEKNHDNLVIIIAAVGELGYPLAPNIVSEYLYHDNHRVVMIAVESLKKLGGQAAIQRLAEKLGGNPEIDKQIIDAFSDIQDNFALEKLNETMISHDIAIRNYGKTKLIEIGSKVVPMLLENLHMEDSDWLIHSLNVLAEIGDHSAVGPIRKLLFQEPEDPNVRFVAYEALGMLPLGKGEYVLAAGLADPVENVCMAAARAIDRNYNEVLAAGIRNLLNDVGSDFQKLTRVIIDSESGNIFMDLIEDEFFRKYSVSYIRTTAHTDVRKYFIKLAKESGDEKLAGSLKSKPVKAVRKSKIPRAVVVDDSRMILTVYRTILNKLGLAMDLFDKGEDALKAILAKKPDVVFTDLNMPGMTGVEITTRIRAKYSSGELPVVMITTQQELHDAEAGYKAGVDLVVHKPFNDIDIIEALAKVGIETQKTGE